MNVQELRDLLEDQDGDTEVMIAHQPSWPLAETLAGALHSDDLTHEDTDEDECDECGRHVLAPACENGAEQHVDEATYKQENNGPTTFWLVAGGHAYDRSPYAPRGVFESAGV